VLNPAFAAAMAGEWLPAQVHEKPHLLIGDVSASQGNWVLSKEKTDP
jgi:hypothetical protein